MCGILSPPCRIPVVFVFVFAGGSRRERAARAAWRRGCVHRNPRRTAAQHCRPLQLIRQLHQHLPIWSGRAAANCNKQSSRHHRPPRVMCLPAPRCDSHPRMWPRANVVPDGRSAPPSPLLALVHGCFVATPEQNVRLNRSRTGAAGHRLAPGGHVPPTITIQLHKWRCGPHLALHNPQATAAQGQASSWEIPSSDRLKTGPRAEARPVGERCRRHGHVGTTKRAKRSSCCSSVPALPM